MVDVVELVVIDKKIENLIIEVVDFVINSLELGLDELYWYIFVED